MEEVGIVAEMRDSAVQQLHSGSTLYPAYVRGEAYMALNKPNEAAAEFQKVLDRPGLLFADPVGPRARLELGRALARVGEKAKAKAAYQDFLKLWKNADPDIPILKEAKTEYAELQGSKT